MSDLKIPKDGVLGPRKCSCDILTPDLMEQLEFGIAIAVEEGKVDPRKQGSILERLEQLASGCGIKKVSDSPTKFKQLHQYQYLGFEPDEHKAEIWAGNMRRRGENPKVVKQEDGSFGVFVESL